MNFYWTLLRATVKRLKFALFPQEKKLRSKYGYQSNFRPIFIIGPPRSGSTILYQTLTNFLNVSYISNTVELFKEEPIIGFSVHYALFDSKPHNSFRSSFGQTKKLIAPAEGTFWYKWLPKNVHYISPEQLNDSAKQLFSDTINAILNKFQKNLIIKNLSFSLRLELINQLFPNAFIIYIKRNPLFNAQSVYIAYLKNNVPKNQIWSIKPKNFKQIQNLPLYQKVVAQIFSIEKHIESHAYLFKNNFLTIKYEEFTQNWQSFVKNLSTLLNIPLRTSDFSKFQIKNSNKLRLPDEIIDQLQKQIDLYSKI